MYQRLPFIVKRSSAPSLQGSIGLPFASQFSNLGAGVAVANIEWALRLGLVKQGSKRLDILRMSKFDQLGCLVYAAGDQAHIELGTDLMTSLWVFDDLIDNAQSSIANDPSIIAHVVEYLSKSVEAGQVLFTMSDKVPSQKTLTAVAHAMIDVVHRLVARTNRDIATPFIQLMKEYLQGCAEEAEWLTSEIPSIEEYRDIRARSSAVCPCVEFGFASRGHQLNPNLRAMPAFDRMMKDTSLCVAYVNDIFSYEKDRLHGVVSNIVILFEENFHIDTPTAISASVEHIERTIINDFIEAKRELEASPWYDDAAEVYVAQMESWMRGNFDWYNRELTERYVRCLSLVDGQAPDASGTNLSVRTGEV